METRLSERKVFMIRAAIAISLIAIAMVIFQVLKYTKPTVAQVDPSTQRQRVNVFTAKRITVHRQWTGFGTAEAINSANVPARVTATVESIPLDVLEGASVHEGQLLAVLDDSDFVNQLQIFEQNLASVDAQLEELARQETSLKNRREVEIKDLQLVESELERFEDMFANKAANRKDLDTAERAVLTVRRNLLVIEGLLNAIQPRRDQLLARKAELTSAADTAQRNVERCSIKSPIDGVIQFVDIEVGESVARGERVARVVDLNHIQTPLNLSASARAFVRVGDMVLLNATAAPNLTWRAVVKRIAPEDDPNTRTFAAYVEIDQDAPTHSSQANTQIPLAPGVFVRGTVISSQNEDRVVVPRRSIRIERVMAVHDGVIYSRKVQEAYAIEGSIPEYNLPDDEWAVLDDGVEPGEMLILTPTRSLSDGQTIAPVMVDNEPANAVRSEVAVTADGSSELGDKR